MPHRILIHIYIKFLSSIAYIKPLISAYLSLIPRVTTVLQFSLTEAQCGKECITWIRTKQKFKGGIRRDKGKKGVDSKLPPSWRRGHIISRDIRFDVKLQMTRISVESLVKSVEQVGVARGLRYILSFSFSSPCYRVTQRRSYIFMETQEECRFRGIPFVDG